MIIEFLLLGDEAMVQAEHVLSCQDEGCDDIAHLYDRLTARYAGQAEVFTFIAGMARGHQHRLDLARAQGRRAALPMEQQRSLNAIRHAWDEAERGQTEAAD